MNDILAKLVKEGLLEADARAVKVREATMAGKSLDDALRESPGVSEDAVLRHLAAEFELPFIDLEKDAEKHIPPKELIAKFPARILIDHRLMPIPPERRRRDGCHLEALRHQRHGRATARQRHRRPPGHCARRARSNGSSRNTLASGPTRSSRWASRTRTASRSSTTRMKMTST